MTFKLTRLKAVGDAASENSVSALFDPILGELREYLDNLAKAEQGDE